MGRQSRAKAGRRLRYTGDGLGGLAEEERRRYRERTAAGGCRNAQCTEPGHPEFAIWWKCPAGHREECRYCAVHGPEHLAIALSGPLVSCGECEEWMSPMIEGLTA